MSECVFTECSRVDIRARGLCGLHYQRERVAGRLGQWSNRPIKSSAADLPDGRRRCKECDEVKPLGDFVQNKAMHLGRLLQCKVCRARQVREWKSTNRANVATHRKVYRQRYPEREERWQRERRARKMAAESDGLVTIDTLRSRDGDSCNYCSAVMDFGPWTPTNILGATVDHVVPLAAGGPDTLANTVLACLSCNTRKGARGLAALLPATS